MIRLKDVLIIFGLIAFQACNKATPSYPDPSPGFYSPDMWLAFDEVSKEITAVYTNVQENGDTCLFYWAAKYTEDKINTISWHPAFKKRPKIFGILEMTGKDTFNLYFERQHDLCESGRDFQIENGISFSLSEPQPWVRIWTVKYNSTPLYPTADSAGSEIAILKRHDILRVTERQPHWIKVLDQKGRTGWVHSGQMKRFPG